MDNLEITLVIPYYNGKKYILECLESVRSQTLPPKQTIIVNDGSDESDVNFLAETADMYSNINIQIIHQSNSGQGGARNTGAMHASTKYIAFLDQDDKALPVHNRVLYDAIASAQSRNPQILYASGEVRQINSSSEVVCNRICALNRKHRLDDALSLVSNDLFILPGATIVDRKLFLDIGGFDTRLKGYEDDDFFLRVYRLGYYGVLIDDEVCDWRIHSASTSYGIAMMESRFIYFSKLIESFPDDPFQSRYYSLCIYKRFKPWFYSDYLKTLSSYLNKPSTKALQKYKVASKIIKETNRIARSSVKRHSLGYIMYSRLVRSASVARYRLLVALLKGVIANPLRFAHSMLELMKH